MRALRTIFGLAFLALTIAAARAPSPAPVDPSAQLSALLDEQRQHALEIQPSLRILAGQPVQRLPDFSFAETARQSAFSRSLVERLDRIDRARLSGEERSTWAILRWNEAMNAELGDHVRSFFQVTPYSWSFSGLPQIFASAKLESKADLDRYLSLVHQLSAVFETLRANLAIQRGQGIVPPKPAIDPILAIFRSLDRPGAESPYAVAAERLAKVSPEEASAFRAEVDRRIDAEVRPALGRLIAYLDGDLRRAAPESVGLGQYPGGPAAYRVLVRLHTTLDQTPEALHARGLSEVERIEAEMARLRAKLGFVGTREEFHAKLRTDPRFLAKTPEEVGERLIAPIRRIEPKVKDFFAVVPQAQYGVERLDPALEGSLTFGYYREPLPGQPIGAYLYNGSKLEERPLVNAAALIYHELVPGHHFQIALQRENLALPDYRREAGGTAFIEGWGEYASDLAGEMGMYADPYDAYGRLGMDIFLSSRLVVDTGMNALGWSREKAMAYMKEHTLESDTQIASETLRYSTDLPGQALAYKTGSIHLRDLREKARRELGDRFDIREFHRVVLLGGAMPMAVLDERVADWIAERKAARPAA